MSSLFYICVSNFMTKQLDADLKMLLTKQAAQEALTEMQMSAAEFERQAGNLNVRYSSACKELTESTQKAVTMISESSKREISAVAQEAKKEIHISAMSCGPRDSPTPYMSMTTGYSGSWEASLFISLR